MTEPQFMRSAFDSDKTLQNIVVSAIDIEGKEFIANLSNDNKPYSVWTDTISEMALSLRSAFLKLPKDLDVDKSIPDLFNRNYNNYDMQNIRYILDIYKFKEGYLKNFIIYSPEESSIRQFEREGQIQPLGRNGEGLLKLISIMYQEEDGERINELKSNLKLISWFEDFKFTDKPFEKEMFLNIKDKYIAQELDYLDQRSSNEGFLYLLFYLTLFISDKTPKFFAIDNIDNALNPKLCVKLMKVLIDLAKKHDKQIIFTTHNPAILDGLDLNDSEQKLLVVSRKRNGETKVSEIKNKPDNDIKLSESFMDGLLGGLPKNF